MSSTAERTGSDLTAGPVTGSAPGFTVAGIRAAAAPALERLATTSGHRERQRDFAFDDVRELVTTGLALTGVPVADGGAGGSLRDVADVVITVARADSSVAQALRGTFLTAHQVASRPDLPHRSTTVARLLHGDVFAGTSNERAGGAPGEITTRAVTVEDGWIVTGEKYYSTGGLYAQWFGGTAVDEEGTVIRFTVPVDRDGVELVDDFDAVGQRLTASGTTRLRDVWVGRDEASTSADTPPDNPWQGTWAQLYLAAVQAGIAARALDDAIAFVRTRARPIKHSSAGTSVEDPYVRQTVGQIAALAQAARASVLLAAEAVEAGSGLAGAEARAAGAEASVVVAQAGTTAIAAALEAAELLFDVAGASITDRDLALDRHWRNARTAANHNPRQWKEAVAGAYHLTGEEPPTTGLF